MSEDRIKEISKEVIVTFVVYSIAQGSTFPKDEKMLVELFTTPDYSEALLFVAASVKSFTQLTILTVYS